MRSLRQTHRSRSVKGVNEIQKTKYFWFQKCAHIISTPLKQRVYQMCTFQLDEFYLFIYLFILFIVLGTKALSFRSEYATIAIDKALSYFGVYHIICSCHWLGAPHRDPTANLKGLFLPVIPL